MVAHLVRGPSEIDQNRHARWGAGRCTLQHGTSFRKALVANVNLPKSLQHGWTGESAAIERFEQRPATLVVFEVIERRQQGDHVRRREVGVRGESGDGGGRAAEVTRCRKVERRECQRVRLPADVGRQARDQRARFAEPTGERQQESALVDALEVGRIECEQATVDIDGFVACRRILRRSFLVEPPEVLVGGTLARSKADRPLKVPLGRLRLVPLGVDDAREVVERRVVRVRTQGLVYRGSRSGEITSIEQRADLLERGRGSKRRLQLRRRCLLGEGGLTRHQGDSAGRGRDGDDEQRPVHCVGVARPASWSCRNLPIAASASVLCP